MNGNRNRRVFAAFYAKQLLSYVKQLRIKFIPLPQRILFSLQKSLQGHIIG